MKKHPVYVSQRGLEIAIALARPPYNLSLLPLRPAIFGDDTSGKLPFGNWKDRQKIRATVEEIIAWGKKYGLMNLGAVTGLVSGSRGIYVMDFDDMSDFEWWLKWFGGSPVQTKTGRGIQLFYDLNGVAVGNVAGLFGRKIDGRGQGGYVVVDGQHYSGRSYERLGWTAETFLNLPKLNPEWIQQDRKIERREVKSSTLSDFDRAALWLASTPGAISGQGGHNMTYRIACRMTHPANAVDPKKGGFGLSFDQALGLMLVWNAKCVPSWSIAQLRHKLEDSIRALGSTRSDIIKTNGG